MEYCLLRILVVLTLTTTLIISMPRTESLPEEVRRALGEHGELDGEFLHSSDFLAARALSEEQKNSAGTVGTDELYEQDDDDDLFEGDIQTPEGFGDTGGRMALSAVMGKIWENAVIPYVLEPGYSDREKAVIASAMLVFHTKTCLQFVPRDPTRHLNYLVISRWLPGCSSSVGKQGGPQHIALGRRCLGKQAVVEHELAHAAGFFHEQSRMDRDKFIRIIHANIKDGKHHNFNKYGPEKINHLGTPYDYGSLMHYPATAFSKVRGRRTIVKIKNKGPEIGKAKTLSEIDLQRIRIRYCGEPIDPRLLADAKPAILQGQTTTTTTTTTTTEPPCEDRYRWCPRQGWLCTYKYIRFMKRFCQKTCNSCGVNN